MDGGAWWATVHGVAKSRTRLSDFTFTLYTHTTCSLPLDGAVPRQHYWHMSPVVDSAALTRGTCTSVCVSLQSCLIL